MIFDTLLGNLIAVVVTLVTIIIVYFKWTYQYWKRRNVPYFEPTIPYGNSHGISRRKESSGIKVKSQYDEMKARGWKLGGLYGVLTPQCMIIDLDLVKNIMAKDFQNFTDRPMYCNEKDDPLSGHLFNLGGQRWRDMRVKMSPTFTSGKMKMMFQTLVDCIPNFLKKIESDRTKNLPIDIKETLACFTTDIIGCCAFGLDFNSFDEEDSPFRKNGRQFFNFNKKRILTALFCMNLPSVAKILGLSMTPKDCEEFFINVVKDTVAYREKNNVVRKDFMQLLIDLKNNRLADDDGKTQNYTALTIQEVAAQSFVFFVAGFETSSTTMTFALYELATNQKIQDKLREEINTVLAKHDGKITYEAIQEMKYMDQVINETLRKYPPVPVLHRKCVKDYKVPGQDVILEKGITIYIPVLGIHHDKEYYPDPEKFDPDRFSEENKAKRHHYAHLPFGEGPRVCIGMRFGLMQSKVGLTSLLKNYRITVNKKTIEPLKFKIYSFIPAVEGEVWLNAEKI